MISLLSSEFQATGALRVDENQTMGWVEVQKRCVAFAACRRTLVNACPPQGVRMHEPIPVIDRWLQRVVHDYFNFHAVPGDIECLAAFRDDGLGLASMR